MHFVMSNLHSNKNVKTITVPHFLVGGFNPFEKEKSQNGGSSPNRGVNKTWLKPSPSCCFCLGPTLPSAIFVHRLRAKGDGGVKSGQKSYTLLRPTKQSSKKVT